jgi:hypothetical protein
MSSDKNLAIGVSIATVLIFAAAFMPWGEIRGVPEIPMPFGENSPLGRELSEGMGRMFQAMELTVTVTGWNGNITFGRLRLPNWLVVLAATGVAAFSWLRAQSVWPAPPALLFALAGYGLLHSGDALVSFMTSSKGSAGVGSFLTVLGFAGILIGLVRQFRAPKVVAPPHSPGPV